MNPGLGCQRVTTICQSSVAQLLEFVQGGNFILKNLLQFPFCISGDLALPPIKPRAVSVPTMIIIAVNNRVRKRATPLSLASTAELMGNQHAAFGRSSHPLLFP